MNGKREKKPRQALDSEKSKGFNKSLTSQSMPKTLKLQFSGLKAQCLKIQEKSIFNILYFEWTK